MKKDANNVIDVLILGIPETAGSALYGLVDVPERTVKRRYKAATGSTLIEYLQNLRIEQAKHLLENSTTAIDEISAEIGYHDVSFFRRLFKRLAGLSPGRYRRMFEVIDNAQ